MDNVYKCVKDAVCLTCVVEFIQNGLELLCELGDHGVPKLLLLLLQHDVTVNQHLLEPHPLPVHPLTHILHLLVNQKGKRSVFLYA